MSQLKRYNGTSWETVGGSIAPKTSSTSSDTDTYSCNYINANKQDKIDSSHKISADLVDDSTSTNKFFNGSYTGNVSVTGNITNTGKLTIGSIERNTTDTWVPVIKNGEIQYTQRALWNTKQSTNFSTNSDYLVTLAALSYWNGAYNTSNASNLTYAHEGTIQCKGVTLWTNSNPGAENFAGQQINISNLSTYKYIDIIYYLFYPGSTTQMAVERHYYDSTRKSGVLSRAFRFEGTMYNGTREYTVNSGNIVFGNSINNANSTDNRWYKPYQIIGYK